MVQEGMAQSPPSIYATASNDKSFLFLKKQEQILLKEDVW